MLSIFVYSHAYIWPKLFTVDKKFREVLVKNLLNLLKSSQFYLYGPISQICLKVSLKVIQHSTSLDPQIGWEREIGLDVRTDMK